MIHSFLTVEIGFITLTLVYLSWFLILVDGAMRRLGYPDKNRKRAVGGISLAITTWLGALALGAKTGFFDDFSAVPPRLAIVIFVPLVVIIWFVTRAKTRTIIDKIPTTQILYMQSFRVGVELVLWLLFVQNLLPERMTFEGWNWDILVGVTGPLLAFLYSRNRVSPRHIAIWNIAGLLLLLNIVTIAILSMPLPFRVFMDEPANTIVATFPAIWLPGFLVPLAYTLHIISLMQMAGQSRVSAPPL